MKSTPWTLAVLLGITSLNTFAASIETRWNPPTPPAGDDPATGNSPGKRHGISLVESNGPRHSGADISLFWYLSNDQIQELEMTGVLDLLKEHINPNYDFHNITEEQLNEDLRRLEQILAGVPDGSTPEPGPSALVAGGFLAVLWVARRRIAHQRQPGANPAP